MKKAKNKTKFNLAKYSLAAAVLGLSFFSIQAQALDCDTIADEATKDRCEALEKKADAYRDLIDIKTKQQTTLQKQMALIDAEQIRTKTELQKTHDQVENVKQQIGDLEREIKNKEGQVKYQKNILISLIRSYYEDYQQGILDIVLANNDFSDILSQSDYIQQSSLKVSDVLNSIQRAKLELESQQADLENKKAESEKLKEQLQDKNLNLQYSENQKASLLSKTQGEEQKYQDLLAKVKEEQQQIAEEIQQIESGKSSEDTGPLPPAKSGLLAYPVNPVIITQGYGKTSFSGNYASGKHNGIDFGIKYKNVYAAKSGKVLATGNNGNYAYGRWVVIDHGNGLATLYGHFSKVYVSKGENVKGGETIGISGNTGFSTGPHLHFTVFARKTFEIVESTKKSGLMLPVGTSLNPKNYL